MRVETDSDKIDGGHNPVLASVQNTMLDGLGQLSEYFGFSKLIGQLYGVLLMSPEPMCLDDMMEALEISKASVSMNMRTLEHMGMVRQVWLRGRGDRRKYYEAETDFWQIMSNFLSGREMRDVDRALMVMDNSIERLSGVMDDLSENDRDLAALYLERVAKMQSLFRFAQLVMSTIVSRVGDLDFEDVSRIDIE
jgi:DNA-binding transcriptional regulator GbsR (MarR family)